MSEHVIQSFQRLSELAAADPELARRGRFLTCDFAIGVGSTQLSVSVDHGHVRSVARGPFLLKSHTFSISAEAETWARFHHPVPAPGDHDLLALTKAGRASITGNLVPLMGNLQFVKDLLALPRILASAENTT